MKINIKFFFLIFFFLSNLFLSESSVLNAHKCAICSEYEEKWKEVGETVRHYVEEEYSSSLNYFFSDAIKEEIIEHIAVIKKSNMQFSDLSSSDFSQKTKSGLDFLIMKAQLCSLIQTMEEDGSLFSSDEVRHEYLYRAIDFIRNSHDAEQLRWYHKLILKDTVIGGLIFLAFVLTAVVVYKYYSGKLDQKTPGVPSTPRAPKSPLADYNLEKVISSNVKTAEMKQLMHNTLLINTRPAIENGGRLLDYTREQLTQRLKNMNVVELDSLVRNLPEEKALQIKAAWKAYQTY